MSAEYEVGYGKPPRETRFKKGQSGNPQGRPPGSNNLKTDLLEELRESVLVREGPTEKHLSKQRAMLKSVTMKAIKGDTRAVTIVLNLMLRLLDVEDADGVEAPLTDDDQSILTTLEERFRRRSGEKSTSQPFQTEPNKSGESDGTV